MASKSTFHDLNSSRWGPPVMEKHDIFVVYVKSDDCGIVQDLDYDQRCDFIRKTKSCEEHTNFVNYIAFMYCVVDARNEFIHWLVMGLLLLLICYMFIILGSTADMFLCPALTVISSALHMSENLAGVTLLAFGNASPDIFTSLANLEGDTNLLIAEAFGSSVFIIAAIAGLIVAIQPFKVYPPTYVRDSVIILTVGVYVQYIIADGSVSLIESCILLAMYLLYVLLVIFDQIIIMRLSKEVQEKLDEVAAGNSDSKLHEELDVLKAQGVLEVLGKKSHASLDVEETRSAAFIGETANSNLLIQFVKSLNPIDREEWNEAGIIGKCIIIIKTPAIFVLLLIIPIVDYEKKMHGWCKLLNILHLLVAPSVIIALYGEHYLLWNVSIFVYVAGIACPLMILVCLTSRTDKPPVYHLAYAVIAMILSIVIIQIIASEVISILDTVGIAAKLTPSFLGCTILAWGNSVGDLISNVTLARQGYFKMGFAACFGGPIIITIFGFGITFVYKALRNEQHIAEIRQGSMGPTCNLFLILVVVMLTLNICLAKFRVRRSIGLLLLIVYFLFLLYAVLIEFEIIHSYGTDHQEQRVKMI